MREAFPSNHRENGIEMIANVLDAEIFSRFSSVGNFQAYEYLNDKKETRAEQKNSFFETGISPDLRYPNINPEKLSEQKQMLELLSDDISHDKETHPVVINAYIPKIQEKISEIDLLLAAHNVDMNAFAQATESVYGKPDVDIFASDLFNLHKTCGDMQEHVDSVNFLQKNIDFSYMQQEDNSSNDETVALVKRDTQELLESLHDQIQEQVSYDSDAIMSIFCQSLEALPNNKWSVEIREGSSAAISANQEQQKIYIPKERVIPYDKLKGLLVHEVGTHVARRINGEGTKLQLLGLGLDHYEQGEEGVATMRESIFTDPSTHIARSDTHLLIALALGYDGQKRAFKEIYDIAYNLNIVRDVQFKRKVNDKTNKSAAWNKTVRIFRGTDCKTPGVCFTKDMIYHKGNRQVWQRLADHPEEISQLNMGKYDPANEKHLAILDELRSM